VGRFYRDFLRADVEKELTMLQGRWEPRRRFHNDSHIMPSVVQLRSLLLNETPEQLAAVATPDQFTGPASGVLGSCVSVLRTAAPAQYVRLISTTGASPFVTGLEREVPGPNPFLVQAVQWSVEDKKAKTVQPLWPKINWWRSWKTPTGQPWTFGHVTPGSDKSPGEAKVVPLNWNSQALVY
jgi:hypothetical protein